MKKAIITLIILLFPMVIHAETLIYDVCESGCEYTNLWEINEDLNLLGDLSDKDIIINVNMNYDQQLSCGLENNRIKSLTINGNNHTISQLKIYADNVNINDLIITEKADFRSSKKLIVNNSSIKILGLVYSQGYKIIDEVINLSEILEIDEASFNSIKLFFFGGNFNMESMSFKNKLIEYGGGTVNAYNCQFGKIVNLPELKVNINIYNSSFESLRYLNIKSDVEYDNVFENPYYEDWSYETFPYDIVDMNVDEYNIHSNTTVYFDKNIETKSNEAINLTDYLDYYTEDKEIDYVIEDESIAKIEGLNLTGLKEGQTNITVTTDDGHIVYRIKVNVISKTIEIPNTGIKIKPWVLLAIIILFIVTGGCIYILNKGKKK